MKKTSFFFSFEDKDLVRETLECNDKGYQQKVISIRSISRLILIYFKSNGAFILSFDHKEATKTFEIHCFSSTF